MILHVIQPGSLCRGANPSLRAPPTRGRLKLFHLTHEHLKPPTAHINAPERAHKFPKCLTFLISSSRRVETLRRSRSLRDVATRQKKRSTKSLPSTKITARVSQVLQFIQNVCTLTGSVAQYSATQIKTKINEIQKQIGVKRKARENADDLMKQKVELEKEHKSITESAAEKEVTLKKKIGTIGNIVHDSVPINNDEVFPTRALRWTGLIDD